MDALPPEPIQCEAQAQHDLLEISGQVDEKNLSAFLQDVKSFDGEWEVVSDMLVDGLRKIIFRPSQRVSQETVLAVTFNAKFRGWNVQAVLADTFCAG